MKPRHQASFLANLAAVSLIAALGFSCREDRARHADSGPVASGDSVPAADPGLEFRGALESGRFDDARDALARIPDETYRGFLTGQFHEALGEWVRREAREHPKVTLDAILRGDGGIEMFWLEVAMSEFLSVDRAAASSWYASKEAILEPEANDRILLALARDCLAVGDWRSARTHGQRVVNPEVAKAISDGIGAEMERDIRDLVRASPRKTMAMLLGDASCFETFWIEVAYDEYLSLTPADADKWYEEVGSQTTPEQHDRIALACARAARSLGNPDLALEWAHQIADEELRSVVVDEINIAKLYDRNELRPPQ